MALTLTKTDGGRQASGFTDEKKDCTVRATALAADISYTEAHELARRSGRKNGRGWYPNHILAEARKDGMLEFVAMPSGAQTIGVYRLRYLNLDQIARRYPKGRYVVCTSTHATALIDGVIHDAEMQPRAQVREVWEVRPVQKATTSAAPKMTQEQINTLWARLDALEARA